MNEAEGNWVTAPSENGIAIETVDGRVTNTEDYYIGKDGKAYYLYGPPAPYGDESSNFNSIGGTNYDGYELYLQAVADHESYGGDYTVVNQYGYLGKYQMGEAALSEAGFYIEDNLDYDNQYEGTWSEKAMRLGVNSRDDFLNNPEAQEAAIRALNIKQWRYIEYYGLDDYIGTTVDGVEVTASGLLAAVHLVGAGGVLQLFGGKKILRENNDGIPIDGNGTPVTKYLQDMGGYDLSELLGENPDKR